LHLQHPHLRPPYGLAAFELAWLIREALCRSLTGVD
jgi:hypothetical protein